MTVQYYPNGIGGTVGDSLDTCRPLQTTGNVWYVSSLIGTDAASPAGQNRENPLATLAQAVTNAADEDIVVFLQGHAQTLTGGQLLNKSLTLVGEGTVGGKPGVSFTMDSAAGIMFAASVAGVELRNIYFPANAQNNSSIKVSYGAAATDALIRGCYFECGATDLGPVVGLTATSRMRIENSLFISTATLRSAQPLAAIVATGAITGCVFKDVVVSSGTVGFSNYSAVDFSGATVSKLRAEGLSLLLGADMAIGASATGRVNVQLATGGSRVAWS